MSNSESILYCWDSFLWFVSLGHSTWKVSWNTLYELYTDYVLKNPFYEMEMPIWCELFDINLSQAIQKDRVALLGRWAIMELVFLLSWFHLFSSCVHVYWAFPSSMKNLFGFYLILIWRSNMAEKVWESLASSRVFNWLFVKTISRKLR